MAGLVLYPLLLGLTCVYAELSGYWLHRLLHSPALLWLHRAHMVHHLQLYGPHMKMRSRTYRDRETGQGVAGVGWEWLVPSAMLTVLELLALHGLGVSTIALVLFVVVGTGWSVVTFYWAHEAMHVTRATVFHSRCLRPWFIRARRLHDIHHIALAEGMTGNFGIGFHWFDRLFGTYLPRVPRRRGDAAPPDGGGDM